MSAELLDPNEFGSKNSRPTKESDSYALGMVILEVLSGRVPFPLFNHIVVIRLVTGGKCPERPNWPEGVWFTDDLWRMLNLCWETRPESRPGIEAILEYLEQGSRAWKPLSPQVPKGVEVNEDYEDDWDLSAVSSPSWAVS